MERSKTLPRNEEILTTQTNFNRGFDTSRRDDDVKNYSQLDIMYSLNKFPKL